MTLFTPPQGFGKPVAVETKIIGSGFAEENDPAALIIGSTGVGLSGGGQNAQGNQNNQADEDQGGATRSAWPIRLIAASQESTLRLSAPRVLELDRPLVPQVC